MAMRSVVAGVLRPALSCRALTVAAQEVSATAPTPAPAPKRKPKRTSSTREAMAADIVQQALVEKPAAPITLAQTLRSGALLHYDTILAQADQSNEAIKRVIRNSVLARAY
jgi:hypothetical protein